MKFHLVWLICAVVCFSESLARGGLTGKQDALVQARATDESPTDIKSSSVQQNPLPTAGVHTNTRQHATSPTLRVVARKALRLSQMSADQRRCCKLGQRAAKKGYFCNLDMMYLEQYTNMEHNAKMKFHVKPVSKRAQRFMKHIEMRCLKTHNKSLFKKCCDTA